MARLLALTRVERMVQCRLRTGEQAVVFDLGNDPPVDPIPVELKPFL